MTTKPRQLPPLRHRKTRITLLLNTYLDAIDAGPSEGRPDQHTSRLMLHNPQLWPWGSYRELDKALDQLRQHGQGKWRGIYNAVWSVHVIRSPRHMKRRGPRALIGIEYIDQAMPDMIHVPTEISENAGYPASEAGIYARRTTHPT